ncbi:extracellular catalytic domain type 1 short-chain-length polyhydroxyalkanoate depolymerase [Simplicispira psychrophila]|uniref:extracellular catalytic domain type 1 short-chain-length polyhydroxyalkanoate depolymerase n=1 Tax=Simplicispira psychrophila TaxID=80882 RepID=UPI00068AA001|nr:PHB depolymerase family esterase [Simplicispira psychrophila]
MDWNPHFTDMLGEATELMHSGNLMEATAAIQRALNNQAPLARAARATPTPPASPSAATCAKPAAGPWPAARSAAASNLRSKLKATVEDAVVREMRTPSAWARPTAAPEQPMGESVGKSVREAPDSFERVTLMHQGIRHQYRLYVPPGAANGVAMPLVLMLHGCTQNADDFALGTGMNQAAAPANAMVLYPAQARSANPNGCWNWFEPGHQHRGQGEPELLVAMVRDVMARHPVDAQRVYAAGLSAGGAMAAVLGREYPDVFAAVGVHSGLQAGAANNMMAALSAMNNGAKLSTKRRPAAHPSGAPHPALIVFHGDTDSTVHAKNGEQLVEAALQAALGEQGTVRHEALNGQSDGGQRFTRTVYRAAGAKGADVLAEHWVLHGAGHAWSGGNAQGSYTDARGISATQEMLRFFLEHPRSPTTATAAATDLSE